MRNIKKEIISKTEKKKPKPRKKTKSSKMLKFQSKDQLDGFKPVQEQPSVEPGTSPLKWISRFQSARNLNFQNSMTLSHIDMK